MTIRTFHFSALRVIFLLACGATIASAQTASNRLIITQIYGSGGNNAGYNFQYDYVELYNNTNSDINLASPATSIQYVTAPSTSTGGWDHRFNLKGIVKAHHFFYIQFAGGTLPGVTSGATPDLIATNINMATAGGMLAVVNGTTTVPGICPASFVTLIGYTNTANCLENGTNSSNVVTLSPTTGTTYAVATGTVNTTTRVSSGGVFTDNGNNSTDFTTSKALPRNSALNFGWVVNGTGTVSKYSGTGSFTPGAALYTLKGTASTATTLGGVAMDSNGTAWSVTSAGSGVYAETTGGTTSTNYSLGGLDAPTASAPAAIAVDGNGNVWIANSGTNTVTELSNAGAALSPVPDSSGNTNAYPNGGFSGKSAASSGSVYSAPHGIVVDLAGNVWVTNSTANTIVQIVGAAAPAAPLATAVLNSTTGVRP